MHKNSIYNSPDRCLLKLVIDTSISKGAGTLRANTGNACPSFSSAQKADRLNDRVVPN